MRQTTCIVVVYNAWNDAVDTIESCLLQSSEDVSVLVVDNGSTDGSGDHLAARFPSERVLVARIEENVGFSGGVNEGIRLSLGLGARYLWILTDDIELAPGATTAMLRALSSDPDIGLAGPTIYDSVRRREIYYAGAAMDENGPHHERYGESDDGTIGSGPITDTRYVTGAAMFMRTESARATEGMDASYWLYFEDADLSYRVRECGWRVAYVPTAHAWIKATNPVDSVKPLRKRYFYRNYLRFVSRHRVMPVRAALRHTIVTGVKLTLRRQSNVGIPTLLGALDFLLGRSGEIKGMW